MACATRYFVKPEELQKHKEEFDDDDDDVQGGVQIIDDEDREVSSGPIPPLNIVILIVGTRGDVQPFVAFAKGLQRAGHTVRISTHINFKQFVRDNGIDFYPLKGDPEILMSFMVNHPDMITIDPSEVKKNKNEMIKIYDSTWNGCTASGFRPDVIISNPPVHVHCHLMQKLQVPLHVMFTMPWSPTGDYMHPLAPYQSLLSNRQSYAVVDKMVWVGLGAAQNKFRQNLGLEPVKGARLVHKLKVPNLYCMSPHLAPKPTDWGPNIDVVGFWFLDLKSDYKPPQDLVDFLEAGPPPIYVGFGSIVVSNPKQLSENVIEAIKASGQRAIVGAGWAKLGEGMDLPASIKVVGAVPHDWLFTKCSAVCHHGGAGTTAAGLRAGLPTIVVPFFGDQPFWGGCCAKMGVGPTPIPYKDLTKEKLTQAILFCTKPEVIQAARDLGEKLKNEDGVQAGVDAFHKHLPVKNGIWYDKVWENQRYSKDKKKWTDQLKDWGRFPYSDKTGTLHYYKDSFVLPKGWEWMGDWEPVVTPKTDPEGWRYAPTFKSPAGEWGAQKPGDMVRTRQIIRRRKSSDSARRTNLVMGSSSMQNRKVTLYVEVIEGKGLKNCDITGFSDPFMEAKVNTADPTLSQTQFTKVIDNTLNPVWKELFWFEVTPKDLLEFTCWDDDTVGKDFMGQFEFNVIDIMEGVKPVKDKWFKLTGKGAIGEIHLGFSL